MNSFSPQVSSPIVSDLPLPTLVVNMSWLVTENYAPRGGALHWACSWIKLLAQDAASTPVTSDFEEASGYISTGRGDRVPIPQRFRPWETAVCGQSWVPWLLQHTRTQQWQCLWIGLMHLVCSVSNTCGGIIIWHHSQRHGTQNDSPAGPATNTEMNVNSHKETLNWVR